MLLPHESWRKRRYSYNVKGLYSINICFIITLIGSLVLLPQGLTQHNDDVYIVKPTPAIRLGKEELTTVLLVNNENHGRYINVRPEVGLLTSTARTFIQEGVTTEYATQVLGTTLDNGRVYAQYLKKSSRVLYDSGSPGPSVVTSWVGESLHSNTVSLPQSHNDLFDPDQADWQAIDDRLLGDNLHKNDFIGNTDYVGLRRQLPLGTSYKGDEELNTLFTSPLSAGSMTNSKSAYNFVAQLGVLEENARKVAANKVLPIVDLPTYTIKQNYEPNAMGVADTETQLGEYDSVESFGRNPKFIFQKFMQTNLKRENKTESSHSYRAITPSNRHFATVTYYGFADFTTVVGDSVIIFSPSTSTDHQNYAHITSIKGEATLGATLPQELAISKVPITTAQDIIEPTVTQQPGIETFSEPDMNANLEESTSNTAAFTQSDDKDMEIKTFSSILETTEVAVTPSQSEISSTQSTTVTPTVMFSKPSDEEVLRIFNALANADAKKVKVESTPIENSTTLATEAEEYPETSNFKTFGGATTIFFEDDPFANFVVPSKTTLSIDPTKSSAKSSYSLSDGTVSTITSLLPEDSKLDDFSTTPTNEVTSEPNEIFEMSPNLNLTTSEKNLDAYLIGTTTTPESFLTQSLPDENNLSDMLPNVLIKEIDPDNNDEVPSDCISTSQVFLTQLPKTITFFETVVRTDESVMSDLKTEVRQQIKPTFEIKEATKHYCIQASTIQEDKMESVLVKPTISTSQNEDIDSSTNKAYSQSYKVETTERNNEDDKTELILNTTEENVEAKTERLLGYELEDATEHTNNSPIVDTDDDEHEDDEEEEASGQPGEDDEDDEEIELIYKTLYTTYTYLTTFFHDDSTSISSHTEVVTNVMTSTLGISSTQESTATNITANLHDNEINPSSTLDSVQLKSTKRFVVPSEVESFIRTDEKINHERGNETPMDDSISASKTSETLATFYTTYTYYTTIFAEGDTDIMSHTEVITNIKKSTASATGEVEMIKPTASLQASTNPESLSSTDMTYKANAIDYNPSSVTELSSTFRSVITLASNDTPLIPDLGDVSAITLVTDVRSSSSPGNKQFINNFDRNGVSDKPLQQQKSVFEDQISSESNTDTDEIMPSATLLLQTSFTTFTYYTTMYSGDKTNIISRLETMTNTVTETLQLSKTIDLEAASLPITYFTTFTYWTKLAREGQITTLSREETISNVIVPTVVQQQMQSEVENLRTETDNSAATEVTDETTIKLSEYKNQITSEQALIKATSTNNTKGSYTTNILEPTTYYTTFTYYTTSYETDKTITDSRFETVTNIITPTVTLTSTDEHISEKSESLESSLIKSSSDLVQSHRNFDQSTSDLVLYDFKKIIDAEGISTLFFTTEIKPTIDSDGLPTEVISSSSSLFINDEKRSIQATAISESSTFTVGQDGQLQKQYKTGLVRLIEGTRIANRTTTLYQSKVIGTIIDQRYAQIIESTSSFIFEKTKMPTDTASPNSIISPTSSITIPNIQATDQFSLLVKSFPKVESSIMELSTGPEIETTTKSEVEVDEENSSKTDEKLRFPFQAKKAPFISPVKALSNRNRPQFAPKKNSSATIITRSDFTPTITATPALKTIGRFSSTRKGSASTSSSNFALYSTSSRRFSRPNKSSNSGGGIQASSSLGTGPLRNRFASLSNSRNTYASSSRRLGNSAATIRSSFSRPSLFSSGFPGSSRLKVRPSSVGDIAELASTVDISTLVPLNSQEEGVSQTPEETDDEEESTTESNRRQNNPLLRLRRPLNRPQGFTPARPQSNSPNNAVSLRRNPLTGRSRSGNSITSTTTTTTTAKPKPRTFQPPLISQNRIRPTNSLFPPRNIFGVQKPEANVEETRDLSEEDTNENNDDSEYEDEDDDEADGDEEEENNRRRRSNIKIEHAEKQKARTKREADNSQLNRSNFRNRFRRPKLATHIQAESKSNEDSEAEAKDAPSTGVAPTTPKTRVRFGGRYSGHSSSSTTVATSVATTSNHKAIRPTRPTNNGRAQFTLREKDSSPVSTTQKGLTSAKRPAFRRPQPAGSPSSRRLPNSTVPSSTSGKRRLKNYTNNDSTTTSRNSVTGRTRASSTTSSRSRPSGPSRDSNIGSRNRARTSHNHNNDEGLTFDNGGTIIVTHFIPAEVTIPVINGKVTEYKQVITAKTSTEVLAPQQYTTTNVVNGLPQLALVREDSSVNYNGATEVTRYILHETPTTTITFTPTTIRGRKTSFSHVLPSTVYSVEQVVSTVQPQISANAPLANILLSQLLLGNVGLPNANPLLGALGGAFTQPGIGLGTAVANAQPATPITEYKTHASTYVTTVYEGQSTVLPVTFQGKKILTTVFDTTAQTITATEFITDTIVTTPTVMAQPQPVVNSLLLQQLLLQQHLQQQQQSTQDSINPIGAILSSVSPQFLLGGDNLQELEASNNIRGSGNNDLLNDDDDFSIGSSVDLDDIALQAQAQTHKNGRKKTRKNGKNHKRKNSNNAETHHTVESSVITLYVSGRRPGEFSTVLSTVQVRPDSTQYKRHAHTIDSLTDYLNDGSDIVNEFLAVPPEIILLDGKANYENEVTYGKAMEVAAGTQSLESIVGDVSLWYATQTTATKTNTIQFSEPTTEIKNQISNYDIMESKGTNVQAQVNLSKQNFFA